ncbi:MAG: hypothetical protein HFI75_11385 [Lachnospiraceae bacterium]|nr:hypothetical protein [Lachnospiraceae bacterium]
MTKNDKKRVIEEIQDFADTVLKNVDREQVPISIQLDLLRPKMEELATAYQMDISDIFILYMDGISEIQAEKEKDFQEKLKDS